MQKRKHRIIRVSHSAIRIALSRMCPFSGMPEAKLIISMITQAADDALSTETEYEEEARRFFQSTGFRKWCDLLGLDSTSVRILVGDYWAAKIAGTFVEVP